MKYGKQVTMTTDGNILTLTEQVFANFAPVKQTVINHESVHVENSKDILAIFLKMLDDQEAGKMDNIGIQCIRNKDTGALRIEKSWIPTDLQ
jgi:hypothetical protein